VLLLRPDEPSVSADPFDTGVDRDWFDAVLTRARAAVPVLAEADIRYEDAVGGLYEMSPDGHALLGPAPGIENLYLANGSSGHGVMHAPALGQLLAEIILDGRTSTLDVTALRPDRFTDGVPDHPPTLL
jgi:sarcosine oxidase subunit beta